MNIVGIVAEYNPFHLGHAQHIKKTRELAGENSLIVVAMSGNFVQRGDLAVYSKRSRANAALHSGADCVLELPPAIALSSAKHFATGAVNLFKAMACITHLSFGSESGDLGELSELARLDALPEVNSILRAELQLGVSYASARQSALETISGRNLDWISLPNNILAVEYLAALSGSNIEPLTVKRDSSEDTASGLRAKLHAGQSINNDVPKSAAHIYKAETRRGAGPVFTSAIEYPVLTKLKAMSIDDFAALPDSTEGLGNRLHSAAQSAKTLDGLFDAVKTKRYAMSRIRRMVFCAYLGIRLEDRFMIPNSATVLASNKRFHELFELSSLPLVIGATDKLHEWLGNK